MNYSVYLMQDSGVDQTSLCMLQNATLENAIAFASYLYVNTGHDYEVRNQNSVPVVCYFKVR